MQIFSSQILSASQLSAVHFINLFLMEDLQENRDFWEKLLRCSIFGGHTEHSHVIFFTSVKDFHVITWDLSDSCRRLRHRVKNMHPLLLKCQMISLQTVFRCSMLSIFYCISFIWNYFGYRLDQDSPEKEIYHLSGIIHSKIRV